LHILTSIGIKLQFVEGQCPVFYSLVPCLLIFVILLRKEVKNDYFQNERTLADYHHEEHDGLNLFPTNAELAT
jgi:hypothetical protein